MEPVALIPVLNVEVIEQVNAVPRDVEIPIIRSRQVSVVHAQKSYRTGMLGKVLPL